MAKNMRRFFQMFHVPGDHMEFYYALRENLPDPLTGVIGFVLNDTCGDVHIALEVDDEYMESHGSDHMRLYVDPDDYLTECRIVMTRAMGKQLIRQNPQMVFSLWHEVGHFLTMEKYLQEFMTYELEKANGYTADEYLVILNGDVLEYDKAADDIAAAYAGLDNAVIAINGMIAAMKAGTCGPQDRGRIQALLNRKNRFTDMRKRTAEGDNEKDGEPNE